MKADMSFPELNVLNRFQFDLQDSPYKSFARLNYLQFSFHVTFLYCIYC